MSSPARYDLAGRLRDVVGPLHRALRQQTGGRLTATQGSVLGTINRHGPIGLTDVAAREQLSLPMISKVVSVLEQQVLIDREQDPRDGRAYLVRVSPTGERWLAESRERRDAWLADRLATLEPSDQDAIAAALPALERLVGDTP